MRKYRGWVITTSFSAHREGTTIYGDDLNDIRRRIDAFMTRFFGC